MALWKTIAPVMLPIARVSLPWRTQMHAVELLGQLGRDRGDDQGQQGLVEAERLGQVRHRADEQVRAADDAGEGEHDLEPDDPQARRVGMCRAADVEPVEPERREVGVAVACLGLEVLADVVARRSTSRTAAATQRGQARSAGRKATPMAIA